jgi:hypothetical protein
MTRILTHCGESPAWSRNGRPGPQPAPFESKPVAHPLKRTCGESPRTTKLYDRTSDAISLDEIERILI